VESDRVRTQGEDAICKPQSVASGEARSVTPTEQESMNVCWQSLGLCAGTVVPGQEERIMVVVGQGHPTGRNRFCRARHLPGT
jgi:hypothetical protein